jgi:class 3 adenylate cyclase
VDIGAWLRELGLDCYEQAFQDNQIDARSLPHLTADDLKEMGVTAIGHRRVLLRAIANLGKSGSPAVEQAFERRTSSERVGDAPKRASEAERRQLTVMFVDLVGSTELSARLDPEDMGRIIGAYQDRCTEVVKRWGGHVAKYMGDGVLAYFGWPQAHEDDVERAVHAGLHLANEVGRLTATDGTPLGARVGIATGLVMVGDLVGEGAAQEERVIGETPNLAARLEALAEPGSVVIADGTRRLLGGLFAYVDLGRPELRGFAEPVQAWRVAGESRAESRFEALHGQELTALVGREHEIGLLVDRWERAKEGEGQVVLLSGEPGIGKSRIVRALRERLAGEPHMPLSHYCSPHHSNSALYPVIGLLERAAGFARDESMDARLDKLEALLARGTGALGEAVPLIAALLGIETGARYPAPALSPQRRKQRTLEVLVDQVEGLAARQPVLPVYEDVHWVDPTTLEALDLLIERVQRLPVLVLITFRPEFSPPWTGHAHVMQLSLSRLTRRHGRALVAAVTGGKALPDEVLDQILAKTDGVPLFVEELTKAVLESSLLRDTGDHYGLAGPLPPLAIPATLHDSLMARLDRLAPVKEVAQTAAVIGREFSHELLAAVAPLSGSQLRNALDQLVQSELVFQRGRPPAATYAFKHALVQDTAYQSLLRSRRQLLHGQIADVLEARFPDTAEHAPGVLARHLSEAGMADRASEYYERAGQQAVAHSASNEAVAHFGKALEQLRTLSKTPERTRREIALLTAQAGALVNVTGLASDDLERTYIEARDLCERLRDPHQQFVVEWGLWHVYIGRAEHHRARELADRLIARADSERDPELMLQALHADWSTLTFMGENRAARDRSEQGWALYDREAHGGHAFIYGGHDPGVCSRNMGSWVVWRPRIPGSGAQVARRWLGVGQRTGPSADRRSCLQLGRAAPSVLPRPGQGQRTGRCGSFTG